MLGFNTPLDLSFDMALVREADISWISVNSHKPGRQQAYSLLVHATNKWADVHIDDNHEEVKTYLCQETSRIIGIDVSSAQHQAIHAWRYANIPKQVPSLQLIDTENQIAACGDWCIQGRVEAAFTSANQLGSVLTPPMSRSKS